MTRASNNVGLGESKRTLLALASLTLLFVITSVTGITWGVPTRAIDNYLFGEGEPWSGEKIYRLAGADAKFSPTRGADVDVDPLQAAGDEPILLTATDENIAKIYLRYRLYTYQPDEMITMMAISGMRPSELNFDPRLYQYGGLFLYPVGALIRLCGALGLIDVRSDVVYYLDHPDEFGKFYIVSRAYAALWGLIGVAVVFAIARRLGGLRAAVLASLLFAIMPVVVCMSHEGKPHLPGAVLMLLAVYFGMRCVFRAAGFSLRDDPKGEDASELDAPVRPRGLKSAARADFWVMCVSCGAALGMVINTWPIFLLIPLVAWMICGPTVGLKPLHFSKAAGEFDVNAADRPHGLKSAARADLRDVPGAPDSTVRPRGLTSAARLLPGGIALGVGVYLVTNPYILINLFVNRDVLRSNFGNSLAMYEVSRVFEGFVRVLELTVEGATMPVLVLGAVALIAAVVHEKTRTEKGAMVAVLAIPAAVFFLQFCLIGAGKPAEYGRFGIFPNTALAIGAACVLSRRWTTKFRDIVNWLPAGFVVAWLAVFAATYLRNFVIDATLDNSRTRVLDTFRNDAIRYWSVTRPSDGWAVSAEPAPYNFPPTNFAKARVVLVHDVDQWRRSGDELLLMHVAPVDELQSGPRVESSDFDYFRWVVGDPPWPWMASTQISWANKPFVIRQTYAERPRNWPGRSEAGDTP